MDHECASTAENERKSGESSSSASNDGVAAAEQLLDTVVVGPGECAEAEEVNARHYDQVRFKVESFGTRR